MTVEADLHSRIAGYAGFSALAGSRIYFVEAPQNTAEPYATFWRVSSQRHHCMGVDTDVVHARFQFDCWGQTPNSVRSLLEQVLSAIQRYRGAGTVTIEDILIDSDIDHPKEYESDTYHSSLDAMVIYRE